MDPDQLAEVSCSVSAMFSRESIDLGKSYMHRISILHVLSCQPRVTVTYVLFTIVK